MGIFVGIIALVLLVAGTVQWMKGSRILSIILYILALLGFLVFAWTIMKVQKESPSQKNVQPPIQNSQTNPQTVPAEKTKDQACLSSGGTVATASCCGQTQDFPNNCMIGACGCAPSSSHQVKTCECGAGKCFDGTSCKDSKK